MSSPRAVVIGAGRLAGGYIAPLLHAAGWDVVLVSRDRAVLRAINASGGIWVRRVGKPPENRWIDRVGAVDPADPLLVDLVSRADLLATSVGPSALGAVGRLLAPLVAARLESAGPPVNIVLFENHRRAAELLATGLLDAQPALACYIGTRLGIVGAAPWCVASRREVSEAGVRFDVDGVTECYADAASVVPCATSLEDALAGIQLVRPFEWRIVEKLWVFNAGHATAAYLGWAAGCGTVHEAMARPAIRAAVAGVVAEAQQAFQVRHTRQPGATPIPPRSLDRVLERYADPAVQDPVVRVAREPRRKLASGDRLLGPAVACIGAGIQPRVLAEAAAAALAYADPSDIQAMDLQRELALLGPEETLATVSTLDPCEELTRMIARAYASRALVDVVTR